MDSKGQTADSLIQGNKALQSLVAQLSNNGIQVTIQTGSLPPRTAADAQVSGNQAVITIDPSQMNAAESNGQDATQIVYHEYDHIYYESQPGFFQNMPSTTTFTIGGTTYNYNTANIPLDGNPNVLTNSPGEFAWEHMLIHNDLQSAFGVDKTGALTSGLNGALNPPSNVSQTATADAALSGTSSRVITPPSKTAICNPLHTTSNSLIASSITYVDSGLAETY